MKRSSIACSVLVGLVAWCGVPVTEAVAVGGASAAGASLAKKKAAKPVAKTAYADGLKHYKQGQFQEALDDFRAAHEAKPSTKLRYYIGMCLFELGRWLEAEEELEGYLAAAGKKVDKNKRSAVMDALGVIDEHVGVVTVECELDAAILEVDGEISQSWTIRLVEGPHELSIDTKGHGPLVEHVVVLGGQSTTVSFELDAPVEDASESGTEGRGKLPVAWFASTVGLAGALAVAAVITGSMALVRQSDYESMTYEDDWSSYRQTTIRLGIATDVLWGIAGATALVSVILAIFTDFGRPKELGAHHIGPVVGVGTLGLGGEF